MGTKRTVACHPSIDTCGDCDTIFCIKQDDGISVSFHCDGCGVFLGDLILTTET